MFSASTQWNEINKLWKREFLVFSEEITLFYQITTLFVIRDSLFWHHFTLKEKKAKKNKELKTKTKQVQNNEHYSTPQLKPNKTNHTTSNQQNSRPIHSLMVSN